VAVTLEETVGISGLFLFFGINSVVYFVFSFIWIQETNGGTFRT